MKKLTIAILTVAALTLTGCEDNITHEQRQEAIDADVACHIIIFNYKGHRYLMYKYGVGNRGYCGITHDPDCPCFQKVNKSVVEE